MRSMALSIPKALQAAFNIDPTDAKGQSLPVSLIAAALAYVEEAIGYPLGQR